jgi:hypothetical protein
MLEHAWRDLRLAARGLAQRRAFALSAILTPLGYALARAAAGLLFGVTPADGPTYLRAGAALVAAAFTACLLPALRASRLDPAVILREP